MDQIDEEIAETESRRKALYIKRNLAVIQDAIVNDKVTGFRIAVNDKTTNEFFAVLNTDLVQELVIDRLFFDEVIGAVSEIVVGRLEEKA